MLRCHSIQEMGSVAQGDLYWESHTGRGRVPPPRESEMAERAMVLVWAWTGTQSVPWHSRGSISPITHRHYSTTTLARHITQHRWFTPMVKTHLTRLRYMIIWQCQQSLGGSTGVSMISLPRPCHITHCFLSLGNSSSTVSFTHTRLDFFCRGQSQHIFGADHNTTLLGPIITRHSWGRS